MSVKFRYPLDITPFERELLEALIFAQMQAPNQILEFTCQHCTWREIGMSPKLLTQAARDHMARKHPWVLKGGRPV